MEFPIVQPPLEVGGNNKGKEVGTDRVLFSWDEASDVYKYCGLMTHNEEDKKPDPAGGPPRQPFKSC